jgi:hypothetical protein
MSALPPKADIRVRSQRCPLCAKSGPSASQQNRPYSITSSAVPIRIGEMVNPSFLPVLRLMNGWYLDASTGID